MNVPLLAEEYLNQFLALKEKKESIEKDISLVQHKLSEMYQSGDLDHLKTEKGSIIFKQHLLVLMQGRKIYDYSKCPEIKEKEEDLREAKRSAAAVGAVPFKEGSLYWRVTSFKEN